MLRSFPIIWFPKKDRGLVTTSHAVFRYEDKDAALRHLKSAFEQVYDGLVPLGFTDEGCLVCTTNKGRKTKDDLIKIYEFKNDALLSLRVLSSGDLLHHGNLMLCYYLTREKHGR